MLQLAFSLLSACFQLAFSLLSACFQLALSPLSALEPSEGHEVSGDAAGVAGVHHCPEALHGIYHGNKGTTLPGGSQEAAEAPKQGEGHAAQGFHHRRPPVSYGHARFI